MVAPRVQGSDLALPRLRHHRRWAALAASAVAALTFVMMPGSEARADPTAGDIEKQIDQVWAESEPLIEQYNDVHQKYQQNLAKQNELAAAIKPLEDKLAEAQNRVGAIAAQVYRGSEATTLGALLASGSPEDFAERLSYLDSLSRGQQNELHDVIGLKAQYDTQKAPIDALVLELAAQDKDLTAKKATIEARLSQLQQLRRQAYATSGGTGSLRPWPCPATYEPTNGYKAAAFACSQAGKPYVWAAAGPNSYDCSGLTLRSWAQVGVYLPHNAAAQRRSMPYVDRASLKVGDLVFYYSDIHHVAIYVGDGKVMQAPMAGDVVRMTVMDRSPIHSFGRPG